MHFHDVSETPWHIPYAPTFFIVADEFHYLKVTAMGAALPFRANDTVQHVPNDDISLIFDLYTNEFINNPDTTLMCLNTAWILELTDFG